MNPKFICHPDFADVEIIDIFRKELAPKPQYDHPEHLKNRHVIFRNKFNVTKFAKTVIRISADDSKVAVYMIPTNEELVIAQDTAAIVSKL